MKQLRENQAREKTIISKKKGTLFPGNDKETLFVRKMNKSFYFEIE